MKKAKVAVNQPTTVGIACREMLVTVEVIDDVMKPVIERPEAVWSFTHRDVAPSDEAFTQPIVEAIKGAIRAGLLLGVCSVTVRGIKS